MALLEVMAGSLGDSCVLFVDPPYTAGGKRAGKRLYAHNEVDHGRLFELLADGKTDFVMTYDRAPEIEALVRKHGFHVVQVEMKNTHHARIYRTRDFSSPSIRPVSPRYGIAEWFGKAVSGVCPRTSVTGA